MTTRPKDIGTRAETAVVRVLASSGFPHAERRALAGAYDLGDITGTPGIAWEVKGGKAAKTASDGQVDAWLRETETERVNARADVGILVMQRAGYGPERAGRWWAIIWLHQINAHAPDMAVRVHLDDAIRFLRANGYGDVIVAPV